MRPNKWSLLFFILILCDIAYTFSQNYRLVSLDGDLCSIVLPWPGYAFVLHDPLGLDVLLNGEYYPATNRFFIHFFMYEYFHSFPFFLQNFFAPIESLYYSMTIFRTMIQVILLYLVAYYASGSPRIFNRNFLIAAILVTPLFQIEGYVEQIGITLNSITYTFFYALPFVFILLYFLPFYSAYFHERRIRFNLFIHLLLAACLFVIVFGGPLGAPVILLACSSVLLYAFITSFRRSNELIAKRFIHSINSIPKIVLWHFSFAILLALYSTYIGTHNTENLWTEMPLMDRYGLLLKGLWHILTFKLGASLLFVATIVNVALVSRFHTPAARRIVLLGKFILILCIAYILLLPLGGYREYRPLIIRVDTFAPVSVAAILLFVHSGLFLINNLRLTRRKILIGCLTAFGLVYTNADHPGKGSNACEKATMRQIANSDEPVVLLRSGCSPLSWGKITNPDDSGEKAELLYYWNVTREKKLYYFE